MTDPARPSDMVITHESLNAVISSGSFNRMLDGPDEVFWGWLAGLPWSTIRREASSQSEKDFREQFAETLISVELRKEVRKLFARGNLTDEEVVKAIQEWFDSEKVNALLKKLYGKIELPVKGLDPIIVKKITGKIRVGIVGAGVSGLYTGRLLDFLNLYLSTPEGKKTGIEKFEYDILEATNRVGGRIYTHHFSANAHDYYDVGAMRFPDIDIMKRTFDLFADVGLHRDVTDDMTAQERDIDESPPKPLFKYILKGTNTPAHYNDKTRVPQDTDFPQIDQTQYNYQELVHLVNEVRSEIEAIFPTAAIEGETEDETEDRDYYKISQKYGGDVPLKYINAGSDKLLYWVYSPFKFLMRYNFEVGYQALMKFDGYSVREFLSRIVGFDFYTINWLESLNAGTGWFDVALSEAVIESFTFDSPRAFNTNINADSVGSTTTQETEGLTPAVKWYCIEGGTGEMIQRLNDRVKGEPEYNKVVIGMRLNRETRDENKKMEVYIKDEGKDHPRYYHTVINTTTLGCAARMDLSNCELQTGQKGAIRSLRYSASTKIGIKFTDPWWRKSPFNINHGGVAPSDLWSTRMCVYPSYNLDDRCDRPAVLLASYSWGQDAERIGSMIKQTSPDGEELLRDCLLRDLARLHHTPNTTDPDDERSYDNVLRMLRRKYITHYSYDWNHDPFNSGAFAFFGPGQYRRMMPHLQRPTADSRLHFVGEATSTHHAWIVGALDSALRALCFFLAKTGNYALIHVLFDGFQYTKQYEDGRTAIKQAKGWGRLDGYNEAIFFWQYVLGLLPPDRQVVGDLSVTNPVLPSIELTTASVNETE